MFVLSSSCRVLTVRRVLMFSLLLAALTPVRVVAQDDPDEKPLGDVARSLRKRDAPTLPAINDDNLTLVMEQAASQSGFGSALHSLMTGQELHVPAPDVTCSVSFTADVKSLLSKQYAQMDLPPAEVAKLEGQAVIEGDTLTVPVTNGTDWHLSEVVVAFTVIKKMVENTKVISAAENDPLEAVRPEKKPDKTVIYRMRAAAAPAARTVFSAALSSELVPGEEWHWGIVGAKGYPPQNYMARPADEVNRNITETPRSGESDESIPASQR